MRAIKAAVLYFAIAFGVGLALGPVRVLLVEPRLGATAAVLCEAPILLVAMAMAALTRTPEAQEQFNEGLHHAN